VQFVTSQGAHHKFDEDDPQRFHLAAAQRTLEACPLEFDMDKGMVVDRFTGQRIAGDQVAALSKQACSARGASVKGDLRLRAKAAEAIVGFLTTTFSR
jgi:hypothetical protein